MEKKFNLNITDGGTDTYLALDTYTDALLKLDTTVLEMAQALLTLEDHSEHRTKPDIPRNIAAKKLKRNYAQLLALLVKAPKDRTLFELAQKFVNIRLLGTAEKSF